MDETIPPIHDPPAQPGRPRYRVPAGLPRRDDGRRAGAVISVLVHALIIGLLIVPFFMPQAVIARMQQGAGGAGPAGGGGGGSRGTGGGTVETLHFVRVSPVAIPTPTSLPPVPPPVKVVTPTPAPVPPPAAPAAPDRATAIPAAPAPATTPSVVRGAGGGTGADGSIGAGPGSGGGVGAGTGTGRGGLTGAGTGGGIQANSPPQPIALFLPPLPAPRSVRGFRFLANFDVDSTGKVLGFTFTETPDGSYNRQLGSLLRSIRFKPGTRADGTPVRMTTQLGFDF